MAKTVQITKKSAKTDTTKAGSAKSKNPVPTKDKTAKKADEKEITAPAKGKKDRTAEAAADTGEVKLEVSRTERNAKINELVKLAREQGYITYDDINEAMPESVVSPEEFEGILILLKGMDVEVTENAPDEAAKDLEKEERAKPGSRVDVLDDPVRMYLKQMGQVPLLTREQEVEIDAHRGSGNQRPPFVQPVRIFHPRLSRRVASS